MVVGGTIFTDIASMLVLAVILGFRLFRDSQPGRSENNPRRISAFSFIAISPLICQALAWSL